MEVPGPQGLRVLSLLTGVMMVATPTGCLRRSSFRSLKGEAMTSPSTRRASPENQSRKEAAYATSPTASRAGLP